MLVFVDVENINTVSPPYPASPPSHRECGEWRWTRVSLHVPHPNTPISSPQNEAGVREFHIVQVSSSSQHWKLHSCINSVEDKGVRDLLPVTAIHTQQAETASFQADFAALIPSQNCDGQ